MGRSCAAILLPFLLLTVLLGALCFPCSADPLRETLPNGLEVFVLENPGTASISVDLWVRAGSRYESSKNNGISHFVEHLLFKGTAKRTAKEISRQVAAVGGSMNAYTHREYTQLHISLLPQHLGLALEILADVALDSLMTEEMIAKERKVILEEISLANVYPPSYVLNIVSRTLFPENSLGLPISGTKETVQGIQRDDLIEFYKRYYVPNNGVLTVIGNVDPRAAYAMIEGKFNPWPKAHSLSDPLPPPPRQSKRKEVRQRKFLDQAIVVVALQAMGLRDIDRPAFEIINTLLGSGGNSRLYQEIREKRAMAYLVGSLYHPLSDTGFWATYAGTHPENLAEVQSIFFKEIQRICQEPIPPGELDEIKSYIQGRTLIRNENNAALAAFVAQGLLSGSWVLPAEFIARLQAVTAEEVMRVARTYLREDQFNVIVLKPYPGLMFFRGLF